MIIDIHSHILPGLDNGSKSVEKSIGMLKALKTFGVDFVVATPHYDSNQKSITEFLFDRNESYVKLNTALMESNLHEGLDIPRIILGAEVHLTSDLEKLEGLDRLCVENTSLMLLEMPSKTWSASEYNQLAHLSLTNHLDIILAHYERYKNNHRTDIANRILKLPIYVEASASSFSKAFSGKKLLESLKDGDIDFVGSNFHGDDIKEANILKFRNLVNGKCGSEVLEKLDAETARVLNL